MKSVAPGPFGEHLKALRVAAGFTQDELAAIADLSVHAISALERGERRRPHPDTVRALAAALDLNGSPREAFVRSARASPEQPAAEGLPGASLPLSLTALLGRDAEVHTLRQWLADPGARLITLVGPGGVGKTRLALEIARDVAAVGATRVVLVELAAIRDAMFVGPAIAEALGLSDATLIDLPRRVRVACDGGPPTLLVLDNCEQVPDAAPLVSDLLAAVTSLRLLATSRAPLRVRGERLYAVGPLPLLDEADDLSLADLARTPAVRLFVERVRDVHPAFRLSPANARAVVAICRRLDALPLALELAASWMKVLTADELCRRLEQNALLFAVGARDLPERQQTMNATVAWSYELLDGEERRAFRRLGALPGRFSTAAAAAVLAGGATSPEATDAAVAAAAALIDRSLLHRVDTAMATRPLYQMLETVRAYAAQELAAADEHDEAREGLIGYCTREAAAAETGLTGPGQIEWLDRVRDDLDNHRGALAYLIERRRGTEAAGIAWGLLFFWLIRGRAAEGRRWYQQILELGSLPAPAESRLLVGSAVMAFTHGDRGAAREALTRVLATARGAADPAALVQADNLLGHVEHAAGNGPAARAHFARSVDGFKALGVPWGIGNALMGLASVVLATGDADQAECLLDEATTVLRRAGPWFLNLPLYLRAILAVRRSDPAAAIAFVRESLACTRQLQDQFAFVYALVPLAAAAAQQGDDAWAARILGARDAVTARTGAAASGTAVLDLREQAERQGRARLGPERWDDAYHAGRRTSIESLLTEIETALT